MLLDDTTIGVSEPPRDFSENDELADSENDGSAVHGQ